jgi:hypothetical protein
MALFAANSTIFIPGFKEAYRIMKGVSYAILFFTEHLWNHHNEINQFNPSFMSVSVIRYTHFFLISHSLMLLRVIYV